MKKWLFPIFIFASISSWTQEKADSIPSVTTNVTGISAISKAKGSDFPTYNKRKALIIGVHATAYAGTLLLLSQAWYKDYPKAAFHTFNDSKEWQQADKVGHAWTAYNIAKYSTDLWKWAGYSSNRAVILGSVSGFGYQTILEFLDAHSAEWGWSWGDMAANTAGVGLFSLQALTWKEQRIQFKFSSSPSRYKEELENRANTLFGKSFQERLLKDYNAQTYWLSFNLHSFLKESHIPSWLNVAVGYGAQGLYGGFENRAYDKDGAVTFDRRDIQRQRQWYVSPDIDFTKIKTRKRLVRTTLSLLNMLKIPAPALEFSNGKLKGHLLYF